MSESSEQLAVDPGEHPTVEIHHELSCLHVDIRQLVGEHPKAIQTRLGHSSIQVTIDRYGHLMDGLDGQTADRLDAIAQTVGGPGVAQTTPPTDLKTRRNPR